jgi:hypothetical protein
MRMGQQRAGCHLRECRRAIAADKVERGFDDGQGGPNVSGAAALVAHAASHYLNEMHAACASGKAAARRAIGEFEVARAILRTGLNNPVVGYLARGCDDYEAP